MNQARTEIYLPVSSDDIRSWAANVNEASPVGAGALDDYVGTSVSDLHAGVELTFDLNGIPLHTIAFFGEPNETELEIEVTG